MRGGSEQKTKPVYHTIAQVEPESCKTGNGQFREGDLMRIDVRRAIISLSAALLLTACGPFNRGSNPDAAIIFHNDSSDQVDVYALGSGGDPIRIGTVFAGRTETLRVPSTATGATNRVNVVARIFASSRVVSTGPFTLGSGQTMDVRLTSDEKILSVLPTSGG